MKAQKILLCAALAIGAASSAKATLIQIEFSGTYTGTTEILNNVSSPGTTPISSVATGRFVFDEAIARSLYFGTANTGTFQDQSNALDWISGQITVNGTTFIPTVTGDGITQSIGVLAAKDHLTQSQPYQFQTPHYDEFDIAVGEMNLGADRTNTSSIRLSRLDSENSFIDGTSPDDLINALTTVFSGGHYAFETWSYFSAPSTYTVYAATLFGGDITSVSVTRLDDQQSLSVPETSSIALLAAGIVGLGFTRRLARK